jgi:hypothetical protein
MGLKALMLFGEIIKLFVPVNIVALYVYSLFQNVITASIISIRFSKLLAELEVIFPLLFKCGMS